ncbi:MAG: helix-turn-helix transcriptional regulator [Firmicutes bacterium]|nr:helix-turn-helix transcriptional regulator [Bacillota bacterium]
MYISYKKLWKLLIDKDIKKKELARMAGISQSSLTKLTNNENITTDILLKICVVLDCELSDITEIVK